MQSYLPYKKATDSVVGLLIWMRAQSAMFNLIPDLKFILKQTRGAQRLRQRRDQLHFPVSLRCIQKSLLMQTLESKQGEHTMIHIPGLLSSSECLAVKVWRELRSVLGM